ncbi:dimeric dUTPase (all-alpha-NTP-PPase superfamily) [Anoxybacillus voinovskiensis]|uniref:Dimeric dUTPase (All-alpha-NTP-PPase superfamily) n=1 Tax=Anoxybacteroides voinovskiense TaxID=230470 RepID=A0A840DXF6_9BACL|nr:dUTP diphosphatase [Anoxybacillus voinovskiensis]MBB4074688.1 dimeric dUTPase (all-alpha-NTP-PPase superfamily) [Anoxybacillus voinovskiensis]GGJ72928.1 hypothetical protein GCM10008982_22690 [Anoxybacillus voinovskiensis]
MDLSKLFEMQRELDERIVREKGLEGQNLLPNKILALQVELAELANEWQGFKHWKTNRQPKEGMLEEYVDCLHFVLSIGLELKEDVTKYNYYAWDPYRNIVTLMLEIIHEINMVLREYDPHEQSLVYVMMFCEFIALGEALGFTWDEVEAAYMRKNAVNHHRQIWMQRIGWKN